VLLVDTDIFNTFGLVWRKAMFRSVFSNNPHVLYGNISVSFTWTNSRAWLPDTKNEMVPLWWYFQPAFNCPHEVERVGRINDGGKVHTLSLSTSMYCLAFTNANE
jgi:hypothetical protein